MKFFYDTYALIEIHQGNNKYQNYLKGPIVLTTLNLVELMYHFVRLNEREEGERYIQYLSAFVVEIPRHLLWQAMEFKLEHKKDDLSFADCIGYVYARENGMRFLTGDEKFKNMAFVEFVK